MFAKEASSTQLSLCWDAGDDVPHISPNFGRKGDCHGNAKQNTVSIFYRDPETLVLVIHSALAG